ncbi:sugar phosphate nucleotidyltransferase [Candidatus Nitronereus thalassa]|uniref:Sugar phosphate nucleotidyltransferase n=1 Tax=Candidatus Nitronereus thalassa TaxID=3020898 RepID=A0ABU3K8Q2_9BACT|nr:sugar phosphate nucleotidyltransferase [Candidatus Nitronereus thalassa]MDT7042784.1 sugar phosphate nucleotidyltransferase [Candidatus Nitronereus thalassa]
MNAQPRRTLWSVVLAGGEGERTRPFIERWLGCHLPKQYCAFVGTRSMLQHTWDRADQLGDPDHKLTVMAKNHHRLAWEHLEKQQGGKVLFQPHNRDTAAGVFLPLAYVRTWNPEATVVVFPSDHFIFPEQQFVHQVQQAVQATDWLTDRLILLGLTPTHVELEYGWIEPGEILGWCEGSPIKSVKTFLEKPDRNTARKALANGALWNTMVLTGKVETLWRLGWMCFPEIMARFEQLTTAIGTPREGAVLEAIYQDMPRQNFSSGLLQRVPDHVGVLELQDVMWSDWGNPDRIIETLHQIGKTPVFRQDHTVRAQPVGVSEQYSEQQFVEVE